MFLLVGAGSYTISRITDQAYADARGLTTLRHGTDPLTWIKIHTIGLSPSDDKSQLTKIVEDSPERQFTVASSTDEYGFDFSDILGKIDQKYGISNVVSSHISRLLPSRVQKLASTIYHSFLHNRIISVFKEALNHLSPTIYRFLFECTGIMYIYRRCVMYTITTTQKAIASYRFVKQSSDSGKLRTIAAIAYSILTVLFVPTIKIRMRPDDVKEHFQELNNIPGRTVLNTKKNIFVINIGILGSLKNSIRIGIPSIFKEPGKVIPGILKLTIIAAVILGSYLLFPGFFLAYKTAIIAGAILAAC